MGRYTDGFEKLDARIAKMPKKATAALHASLEQNADELVSAQKSIVRVKTGTLRDSIRKEDGRNELQVIVRAGGPATTKEVRSGSGVKYDYSLGTEFGTQEEPPHGFFWPSYRLLKKRMRSRSARAAKKAVLEE